MASRVLGVAARAAEQVAVLALDLGADQGPGQPQAGRLVGQGAVLPEPALDLAGRGRQAGDVPARGRQPVDGDVVVDAEVDAPGS